MRYCFTFVITVLMIGLLVACSTTKVYIVRHAEKVDETDSTDLSPAGRQRAVALADTLAERGIDSIFTTPYRRTRQTAEPLASRIGVRPAAYAAAPVDVVVNRVGRIRGKNVLVVGHSNTILDIARGLGVRPRLSAIASGDFDNLLRVRIQRGPLRRSVRLAETTYGAPTAP